MNVHGNGRLKIDAFRLFLFELLRLFSYRRHLSQLSTINGNETLLKIKIIKNHLT